MSIIHEFKSIRCKLERQDQKAEFEAKNPEPVSRALPYGVAIPWPRYEAPEMDPA